MTATPENTIMKCPRDGSALKPRVYEAKIEVDECTSCRGTWLDEGELESIQSTVDRDYRKELGDRPDTVSEGIEAKKQEQRGGAGCPKCRTEMEVRPYGMGSQIAIDVCPEGCGVWLDPGELAELEKFFERSQSETTIPLHWRMWASVVGLVKGKKKKPG